MRGIVSISLLTLYLSILLRPAVPYIEYAVNKDYIAKVLCINKDKPQMKCHGKCHRTAQIKKIADEDAGTDQNKLPVTPIKEVLAFFVTSETGCEDFGTLHNGARLITNENSLTTYTGKPDTPPPRHSFS
ncbi:MAG: hypothetical protein KDD36_02810 [Flavobacteriales bacterium]|nr:hypothetical protein [Flavobacteriales bacterium]